MTPKPVLPLKLTVKVSSKSKGKLPSKSKGKLPSKSKGKLPSKKLDIYAFVRAIRRAHNQSTVDRHLLRTLGLDPDHSEYDDILASIARYHAAKNANDEVTRTKMIAKLTKDIQDLLTLKSIAASYPLGQEPPLFEDMDTIPIADC